MHRCPRCSKVLVHRPGEAWCVTCGTVSDVLVDRATVPPPRPVLRRDLYARAARAWSPAEVEWLERNRDRMSLAQLGARLKRSPHAVEQKLNKLRLRKRRVASGAMTPRAVFPAAGKRWTREEISLVLFTSVETPPGFRSRHAWRVKLARMGEGGLREQDGMMSEAEVAREYGVDRDRVRKLREIGALKAVKRFGAWRYSVDDCEAVAEQLTRPPRRGVALKDPRARDREGEGGAKVHDDHDNPSTAVPDFSRAQDPEVFFRGEF